MKRSHSDAFEDDHLTKVQRVHGQVTVTQRTLLPQDSVSSSTPNPDGVCVDVDLRRVMDEFIAIYERLDTSDDPLVKPNYSYTELVYLALLRSPTFCLPINEIYKYIQTKFQFFRRNIREHWRNAVRHSLSKTKCFTKIGVRRGPNSSGTYNRSMFLWTFYPSSIVNFARGDYRPSVDKESGTNTLRWGFYRINAGEFWDKVSVSMETKMTTFKQTLATSSVQAQIFEHQLCILPTSDSHNTIHSPSSNSEVYYAYCQSTSTSPPTASPNYLHLSVVSQASTSPALSLSTPVITNHKPVSQSQGSPSYSHLTYSQTNNSYFHRSPALEHHKFKYVRSVLESPSYNYACSTPVQSALDTTSLRSSFSSTSPTCSSPDILACAWNAVRSSNESECNNSGNFSYDSGIITDYSSPDNSFFKSLIGRHQHHSPVQNINMFSPSLNHQRFRSCNYSHDNPIPNGHPQDIFNEIKLLSEISPSLCDLTSASEQDSTVFDSLAQSQGTENHVEASSHYVTSSNDNRVTSSDNPTSCVYETTKVPPTSSAHTPSTSCLLWNGYEPELFDVTHGVDPSILVSTDNLASYSH